MRKNNPPISFDCYALLGWLRRQPNRTANLYAMAEHFGTYTNLVRASLSYLESRRLVTCIKPGKRGKKPNPSYWKANENSSTND